LSYDFGALRNAPYEDNSLFFVVATFSRSSLCEVQETTAATQTLRRHYKNFLSFFIEAFMKPTAVMFGAGNVGRGFLGQLLSESGYEVVFVDVDSVLVQALDREKNYTIRLVDNDSTEEVLVSPVRAVMASEVDAAAEALAHASIAATAVGARALPYIAPLVAAGVARRAAAGNPQPINIIICENLHGAAEIFRSQVSGHVPAEARAYFDSNVGFVNTVIGRMVPPPTPEMRAEDPRLIAVEHYKELPVDRAGFIGPIPQIIGMQPIDNFGAYTARKLYLHNCGHAVLAYLGYLRGHEYGYQALVDPVIRPIYEQALAESQAGIVKEFGVDPAWLSAHCADLTRRYANRALGDTIYRLGRDPIRKLAPSDRLVGAARLAEKAGIEPRNICTAIAAALRFDHPDDPIAMELKKKRSQNGLDSVLSEVCAVQPGERMSALIRNADLELEKLVKK
jgi:mannitol-1-phosphate 5-dehydrogenase